MLAVDRRSTFKNSSPKRQRGGRGGVDDPSEQYPVAYAPGCYFLALADASCSGSCGERFGIAAPSVSAGVDAVGMIHRSNTPSLTLRAVISWHSLTLRAPVRFLTSLVGHSFPGYRITVNYRCLCKRRCFRSAIFGTRIFRYHSRIEGIIPLCDNRLI